MRMQIEPTFIGRLRLPTVMPSGKRIFAKRSLSVGAARPLPVGITRTAAVPGNRNDSLIGLVEFQKKSPALAGLFVSEPASVRVLRLRRPKPETSLLLLQFFKHGRTVPTRASLRLSVLSLVS